MSEAIEQSVGRHRELREILRKFYPDDQWPDGLLPELWKMMGRVENRGFDACLAYYDERAEVRAKWNETHLAVVLPMTGSK